MLQIQRNSAYIILIISYLIAVYLVASNWAYFGGSDSIEHFLFAEFAWKEPIHFLNHWAKPLVVLVYAIPAKIGFVAAKLTSLHLLFFTAFLGLKLLKNEPISQLVFVLLFITSSSMWHGFNSTLTEPLFAFLCLLALYFYACNKLEISMLILSFLPFLRSEGLLFIGFAGILLLLNKQIFQTAFLLAGSIVYGFVGLFAGKSFLWMFTEIPYSAGESVYGSGSIFRFIEGIYYSVGPLNSFIISVGLCYTGYLFFKNKQLKLNTTQNLALAFFLVYVGFHSIAWYIGRFNSMGLLRVLIAVLPLLFISTSIQFKGLFQKLTVKQTAIVLVVVGLANLILLNSSNPAAVKWKEFYTESNYQQQARQVIEWSKTQPNAISTYYFNAPIFGLYTKEFNYSTLSLHAFNKQQITQNLNSSNCFIWDAHHTEFSYSMPLSEFEFLLKGAKFNYVYGTNGELLFVAAIPQVS